MSKLMRVVVGFAFLFALTDVANAQNCTAIPNPLTNGTTADGSQVYANFQYFGTCAASAASPQLTGTVAIGSIAASSAFQGGTISPTLQVQGGTVTGSVGFAEYGASAGSASLFLAKSRATSGAQAVVQPSDTLSKIYFEGSDGTSFQNAAAIFGSVDPTGPVASGSVPGQLDFYTTPIGGTTVHDRMTIMASGNVGIGNTTPGYTLQVNGSVAGTSAYVNTSDARLKKNIRPIADALSIVERLRGVRFDWRGPQERSVGKSLALPVGTPQLGFIAQDLRDVLPEAVSIGNDPEKLMSVAESKVVPVLVEAVKELKDTDNRLQAQIGRQASDNALLKSKFVAVDRELAATQARLNNRDAAMEGQAAQIARLESEMRVLERKSGVRTAMSDDPPTRWDDRSRAH